MNKKMLLWKYPLLMPDSNFIKIPEEFKVKEIIPDPKVNGRMIMLIDVNPYSRERMFEFRTLRCIHYEHNWKYVGNCQMGGNHYAIHQITTPIETPDPAPSGNIITRIFDYLFN